MGVSEGESVDRTLGFRNNSSVPRRFGVVVDGKTGAENGKRRSGGRKLERPEERQRVHVVREKVGWDTVTCRVRQEKISTRRETREDLPKNSGSLKSSEEGSPAEVHEKDFMRKRS